MLLVICPLCHHFATHREAQCSNSVCYPRVSRHLCAEKQIQPSSSDGGSARTCARGTRVQVSGVKSVG